MFKKLKNEKKTKIMFYLKLYIIERVRQSHIRINSNLAPSF